MLQSITRYPYSFPRAAWECSHGVPRRESQPTLQMREHPKAGRGASTSAFPRSSWERDNLLNDIKEVDE